MTVKRFSELEKDRIVHMYQQRNTITAIAIVMNTSKRTIGRVLVERGLATPVPRVKGEAYLALRACAKYGVDPTQLDSVLSVSLPDPDVLVREYVETATKEQLMALLSRVNDRIDHLILGTCPLVDDDEGQSLPMTEAELMASIPTNPITPSELTHELTATAA